VLKQHHDEKPKYYEHYDVNDNKTCQEKLLSSMEYHFDLLDLQNENVDNDFEMQYCYVTYEVYFFILPDHNKSPIYVTPKKASI